MCRNQQERLPLQSCWFELPEMRNIATEAARSHWPLNRDAPGQAFDSNRPPIAAFTATTKATAAACVSKSVAAAS